MHTTRRLADFFSPEHYKLGLKIERKARTFSGTVEISGTSVAAGPVWLHSKDIAITSCTVDGIPQTFTAGDNDEVMIATELNEGQQAILRLEFSGIITDQMHGMYPCYFDHDGVEKELIATQFESHHAREVFPCIDEPSAKATFDVTLTTEADITVLGNMPVARQDTADDYLTTSFETTPKMSTYLLAWVCGDLQRVTATSKAGVEVNVWSTPAQSLASLDFALDIAVRSIDFYNDYFGTPYPLPKCDHVALPDFSSGAMENWGLITYREMALLADPSTTSVSAKHYIATVIAHELAHQWFGNLVTMKWWNDLWLNESFATLMEYIAIDALEPSWNVWLDFASNETVMALRRDALDGVQAVQVDVGHPDEISTLFDSAIVYAKGARLLRMLETYVGKRAFQDGLKHYFETYRYTNTAADDLWGALEQASGKPIATFMNTWISQPGYPVLSVESDGISQAQFFIGSHQTSERLWPVPLRSNIESLPELIDQTSVEATVPLGARLNTDDSAHFITKYAPAHLEHILRGITDTAPLSRLQLMHEQGLLARGGMIESKRLIALLQSYQNETIESVWDIMALTFSELKRFVEHDDASTEKLRAFGAWLARARFAALGWDQLPGETESDTKQRATILGMMSYSEDPAIIAEASRRFDQVPLSELPAEIRPLIIAIKVKFFESEQLIDELLEAYRSTSSSDLKQDICAGLTATRSHTTAQRLLDLTKDPKTVKTQDAFRWFIYLIRTPQSRDVAWEWLQSNWTWVKETFGGDKSYDDYPRYAASGLMTRQHLQEYETFFAPMKDEPALTRTISLGIAEINARIELLERDRAGVIQALGELSL